jgi:hypothetical protein
VLSNDHFDKTFNTNRRHQDKKSKDQNKDKKEKEEAPEMSFASSEGKCYCCGKGGHKSPTCRMKDKIQIDKWEINKAKSAEPSYMNAGQPTNATDPSTTSTETRGWSGGQIQYQFYQSTEIKDVILLDNGSTVNL